MSKAVMVPPAGGLSRLTWAQVDLVGKLCLHSERRNDDIALLVIIHNGKPVSLGLSIPLSKYIDQLATPSKTFLENIWAGIAIFDAKISSLCAYNEAIGMDLGLPAMICGQLIEIGQPIKFEKFKPTH